jgi:hypothetical protein
MLPITAISNSTRSISDTTVKTSVYRGQSLNSRFRFDRFSSVRGQLIRYLESSLIAAGASPAAILFLMTRFSVYSRTWSAPGRISKLIDRSARSRSAARPTHR